MEQDFPNHPLTERNYRMPRHRLRNVVFLTHGDYNSNFYLSRAGIIQMADAAEEVAKLLGTQSVKVVTSPAARAFQGAEIVGRRFNVQPEKVDALWIAGPRKGSVHQAVNALLPHMGIAATLIVVTHPSPVRDLPKEFARAALGFSISSGSRGYGKGWLINVAERVALPI